MAFTLTLLGTDTQYAPNEAPLLKEGGISPYPRGESLSFVSSLINPNNDLESNVISVKLSNDNVAVVDGPETTGTDVGDRIAHGVRLALSAIARGEKQINIIAHSRGAIEAILVAHELERIQNLCKKGELSLDELKNSVDTSYTKKAMMSGEHKEGYGALDLNSITSNMANVTLSILNVDPVPGGDFLGITHLSTLAWKDERMLKVPAIVSDYEEYLYENERTRCFKPVIPEMVSEKTKFTLRSLPGHHGTGSGNLSDQQFSKPIKEGPRIVQEILITRTIDFLKRNGTILNVNIESLEKHPLKELMTKCQTVGLLSSSEPERSSSPLLFNPLDKMYLNLYDNLKNNLGDCKAFDQTSYAVLGLEQGMWKLLGRDINQRIVHHKQFTDTYLNDIITPVSNEQFLSYEHARLYLNEKLGLNSTDTLDTTITIVFNKIKSIMDSSSSRSSSDYSPDINLLADKEIQGMVIGAVDILCNEVQQYYFQGVEKNPALYNAIQYAFTSANELPPCQFSKDLINHLKNQLNESIIHYHSNLMSQYEAMNTKIDVLNTYINELKTIKRNFKENLAEGNRHIIDLIDTYLEQLEHVDQNSIGDLLIKQQTELSEIFKEKSALLSQSEPIEVSIAYNDILADRLNNLINDAIQANTTNNVDHIIPDIVQSCNTIDTFIKGLDQFKALDKSIDARPLSRQLKIQQERLINLGAQYLSDNDPDHKYSAENLNSNNAYKQIELLSIAKGRTDPKQQKLDEAYRIIEEQKKLLSENQKTIADLNKQVQDRDSTISTLKFQLDETTTKDRAQQEEIARLQAEVSKLQELSDERLNTTEDQRQTINELKAQIQSSNFILEEQSTKLEENAIKIKDQQDDIQELTNIINDPHEQKCQQVINNTLMPLTLNYIKHLEKEITHLTGKKLLLLPNDKQDFLDKKANINSVLKNKVNTVLELHKCLTDTNILQPSKRITDFKEILNNNKPDLSVHRDSAWLRFFANAAKAIAVVVKGIVPGLAPAESPKFWQSKGKTFFDKCDKEAKDILPENDNQSHKL